MSGFTSVLQIRLHGHIPPQVCFSDVSARDGSTLHNQGSPNTALFISHPLFLPPRLQQQQWSQRIFFELLAYTLILPNAILVLDQISEDDPKHTW